MNVNLKRHPKIIKCSCDPVCKEIILMKISKLTLLALALLAVPASMGVPNPAAVYCDALGYSLETRTDPEKGCEVGCCIFPDGSECDERDYFDGECAPSDCSRWTMKDGCKSPIEFAGLISKTARINNSAGQSAEDVLGWDVARKGEDGNCLSYYVAQAPLIGTNSGKAECVIVA
jgi:putative hemolysin